METKRLNVNVPISVYNDLNNLASENHKTISELMRTAFVLLEVAYQEKKKKNKLTVSNQDGKPIKELIIP